MSIKKYRFDTVRLVIADPKPTGREVLDVMRNLGFRKITYVRDFQDLMTEVERTVPPELLMCDTHFEDGDLCKLARSIRHHEMGGAPFMPIIGLTWHPTGELVREVIDAGADNLLIKPISPEHLLTALERVIDFRKPFLVTSDYIGPDRRRESRGEATYPLIDVPNLLKLKAMGQEPDEAFHRAMAAAVDQVNDQKVERHGFQIDYLTVKTILAYRDRKNIDEAAIHLEKLLWVAEDAARRIAHTPHAHLAQLFKSTFEVAHRLRDDHPKMLTKELKLLAQLASAVRVGVGESKDHDTRKVVGAIASTVKTIH